jgi:hypothetical protein
MGHEIHRVISFEKVVPFILLVRFEDNTSQLINFQPVLRGELYGPLRDVSLFDQVCIDPEVHTLVWPNGADFDSSILHDWPESGQALRSLAENWKPSRPETNRAGG